MKQLALTLLFLATVFKASAYDFSAVSPSGHTLYYNIVNGHAEVVRPVDFGDYNNYAVGDVIIPATVTFNGVTYAVTALARGGQTGTFYACSGLTSVSIPSSVTTIGYGAFQSCTGLTSVVMSEGVTTIGIQAFNYCTNLSSITIPNSVLSIEGLAFRRCYSLNSIVIPCNVSSMGQNVFQECSNLQTVWMKPTTPPTIANNTLGSNAIRIVVPRNSYSSYNSNSDYSGSGRQIYMDTVIVTVSVDDTTRGNVSNSHLILPYLGTVEVTATPYYGYRFAWWCEDYVTDSTRWLTDIPSDVTLTAHFIFDQFTITLLASEHGVPNPYGTGSYDYLSEQTISAVADYGYHFSMWSDGDTNNPRVLTITQDTTLYAIFEKNNYYIVGIPDNTEKGNVIGSDTVEYLDTVVLTATSNYGYHFSRWSDNNTSNPRQFIATQNRTITAIFDYNQYTITLNVDSNILGSTNGGGSYNYLSEQTITATASYGQHGAMATQTIRALLL